ncbi:MAG: AAA family ATPase [Candidatus Omnitrophota bacterium]|jgi:DNA polymerase III delta prime subunit|nr:MAG: AAA family ATPase [Candidatus Omnitrophota bacterium]
MERFFNTAGPVNPTDHYCLPPLERLDLPNVLNLIEQKKYFVLHAPRQTGKTSCLLALADYLNREGKYRCLYCNVEVAQAAREDVEAGIKAICMELSSKARYYLNDTDVGDLWNDVIKGPFHVSLNILLSRWSEKNVKPIILFIDEIDSLIGDTLISVLRQLRAGYTQRPTGFPQSVILCGVRDVRDYRIHSDKDKSIITGGSAFNIKAESLRLGNLSEEDTQHLLLQHTEATRQEFLPESIHMIWDLTQGQPWLVNALAYEACFRMPEGRDRRRSITPEMVMQAKENLILRRETHLDQLADKLREERVRKVIQAVLLSQSAPENLVEDDLQYVEDLGLIKRKPSVEITNPIYREIIPRSLTSTTQDTISHDASWYVSPDGTLNFSKLLEAFQQFFRENSEIWLERFDYKEAGPQLLLQAFLQRIINSGGRIEREYGLGRKRTDLLVLWPLDVTPPSRRHGPRDAVVPARKWQKEVIEIKVVWRAMEHTITEGLTQIRDYMDRCGTRNGHLVIFDRNPAKPWEEKIFRREETIDDYTVTIWGM